MISGGPQLPFLHSLEDHNQKFTVVGQILNLVSKEENCIWNGQYIHFGAISDTDPSTSQQYIFCVPGPLAHTLAPDLIPMGPKDNHQENVRA